MNRNHLTLTGLCCGLIAAFIMFAAPGAQAQVITCCDVTYDNNTDCPITFCVRTASGPVCVTVPAHGSVVITLPNSLCGNPPLYLVDRCGQNIALVNGCVNVALSPNCCAQVCLSAGFAGCWFVTATPLAVKCLCPIDADLGLLGQ